MFSFNAAKTGSTASQMVKTFVRGAHKKSQGSTTHMQDSAGRRLGPKKHEGEKVSVGQIIMRQRGTKWYPGSNVGIGKDHTLFAEEPGYVRYYLDPFHPKRKFIGVALEKDERLPYPHFDPTHRRLGRIVLEGEDAECEANYASRKEQLALPEILKARDERAAKREQKVAQYEKQLPEYLGADVVGEQLHNAAVRLGAIDSLVRGGKSVEDARFYVTYNYLYDLGLQQKARGEISEEEYAEKKKAYEELAELVDSKVMLDARFQLTENLTAEQRAQKKEETLEKIRELVPDNTAPVSKKTKEEALSLIDSPCFTLSEQIHLKRHYLKPVLPEKGNLVSDKKQKKSVPISRINYETNKVETIYRTKNAFLP